MTGYDSGALGRLISTAVAGNLSRGENLDHKSSVMDK
jgi:hypothetical protein